MSVAVQKCILLLGVVFGITVMPARAQAEDMQRGKMLYESRCDGCHDESVHNRVKKAAQDFEAVRGYVRRWNASLGGAWGDDEIADVTAYLNAKYYSYKCPPDTCRVTSMLPFSRPGLQ